MITNSFAFVRYTTLSLSLLCERLVPYPESFQLLRVYRVADRICKALVGGPDLLTRTTTTGARTQLRISLARELAQHELEMQDASPIVEIQLLRVKLALYEAVLRDSEDAVQPEDVFIFHETASRILELAMSLADGITSDMLFWPQSLHCTTVWTAVGHFPVACLVLPDRERG
jgi:hypothetical protein